GSDLPLWRLGNCINNFARERALCFTEYNKSLCIAKRPSWCVTPNASMGTVLVLPFSGRQITDAGVILLISTV
ncbi:MAG: hypothetical protein P4M11_02295, partial [Candidatus Pacebacteria bacterium]|nr:hypothetical protein [Candidatus Paceibacterota bacterium]